MFYDKGGQTQNYIKNNLVDLYNSAVSSGCYKISWFDFRNYQSN